MSESTLVNTWIEKRTALNDSSSTMKETETTKDSIQAKRSYAWLGWSLVALIDSVILIDFVFNGGKNLVNLLFVLTGGY